MKTGDAKAAYEALSAKASDIVRQLSLAGIGLVWLFRIGNDKTPALDQALLRAALWITVALLCDFLQYLIGSITWFLYFRRKEKQQIPNTEEFQAPEQLNWPTWFLFCLKAVLTIVAYAVYIIPYLIRRFVD